MFADLRHFEYFLVWGEGDILFLDDVPYVLYFFAFQGFVIL